MDKELTGQEVAELHKKYILQSWSKAGGDVLPVKKQKEFISGIMMIRNMPIWLHYLYVVT